MKNPVPSFVLSALTLWGFGAQAAAQLAPVQQLTERGSDGMSKTVLTSSTGLRLYVFDPDQRSAVPVCQGECAEKWPPVLLSADEVRSLAGDFGAASRHNGLQQLTYKGRPLYTFYLDRSSTDATGDGLGGVWHQIVISE